MKTGVLLLNLGGPGSQDEIRPFLVRLFKDREIIRLPGGALLQPLLARLIARLRLKAVKRNYARIGGGSPILPLTRKQAAGLESRLAVRGHDVKVAIAMRYTRPSADEALSELEAAGVERLLAVTLYPHYSKATTGSSLNDLRRAMERRGTTLPLSIVDRYGTDEGYVASLVDRVRAGLETWPEERRGDVTVLFSAHSLPKNLIDEGDPYLDETVATTEAVRAALPDAQPWRLSFQSRSGPVEWVGPGTDAVIDELAEAGVTEVLVVPVSFVSDHVETLYEVDLLYGERAKAAGISGYRRTESLNDSPVFLDALADLAEGGIR